MKHLKTYKIFESKFDDFKKIIDNLHDYSMEFEDDGLPVQILPENEIGMKIRSMNIPTSDKEPFYLKIYADFSTGHLFFKFQKYILNIIAIISYMKSEGYETDIELREVSFDKDFQSKNSEKSPISHWRSYLNITSDNFIKGLNGEYIPDNRELNKNIRLDNIEIVKTIKLTFDKINKNYDI